MSMEDEIIYIAYKDLIPGKRYHVHNGAWDFKVLKQNADSVTIKADNGETWDVPHRADDDISEI